MVKRIMTEADMKVLTKLIVAIDSIKLLGAKIEAYDEETAANIRGKLLSLDEIVMPSIQKFAKEHTPPTTFEELSALVAAYKSRVPQKLWDYFDASYPLEHNRFYNEIEITEAIYFIDFLQWIVDNRFVGGKFIAESYDLNDFTVSFPEKSQADKFMTEVGMPFTLFEVKEDGIARELYSV